MIWETIDGYKRRLIGASVAYNQVFHKQNVFTEVVLRDLAKFCRAHESTFHTDPRLHAVLEGRREVWLRIEQYLKLTPDQLYELHKIKEIHPEKGRA